MDVFEGSSLEPSADRAVAEAVGAWPASARPDMILAFTSPIRSAAEVASALVARFPDAQVVGCTTAGEHLSGRHSNGGLVVAGLASPKMRWSSALIEDIATAGEAAIGKVVDGLFAHLGVDRAQFDPRRYFCLIFVDGLSGAEERIMPLVADALDGISLIGGSAGDDLAFRHTEVICGGRARSDAAVLALCESDVSFSILKHQHFLTTPRMLAITKADIPNRRVCEIDGEPAAVAYARMLGIARSELTDALALENPLLFEYQHQLYVRAIQKFHPDDSITFFCAIEEGMVVRLGARLALVPALADDLAATAKLGDIDLLIGSNCILRALESDALQARGEVGALYAKFSKHMIGFDTYGEQLDGLHINQTLIALALRDTDEAA